MNIISIIILLGVSIVCAYIHKNKGYSPIAGFLWGFLFSILGLIIVLLEKDKSELDMQMENKKALSMTQWLLIFLGVGIALIVLFLLI